METSSCPPINAVNAGARPEYGMCVISMPYALSISPVRCCGVLLPVEPKFSLFG
jgi:hypothetical protein